MLSFLLRKMWNNKWMMLSLLIGNILLIGIVSSAPMYAQATLQRVLIRDMQQVQIDSGRYPAIAEFSFIFNHVHEDMATELFHETERRLVPDIMQMIDVPMFSVVQHLLMEGWHVFPAYNREERPRIRSLRVSAYDDFENNIVMTHGRLPSSTMDGNVIEVIVNQNTLVRQDLLFNEYLNVSNVTFNDEELQVRIVGIYEAREGEHMYWVRNPNHFVNALLVSPDLIRNYFIEPYSQSFRVSSTWYMMLDYHEMAVLDAPRYLEVNEYLDNRFNQRGTPWEFRENYIATVESYLRRAERLNMTLWVLQAPLFVLLAFYIFMVSKQILLIEQNDISVLKSRGASRSQIFGVYALQSVFVGIVSLVLGIPLGMWICRMLGASNGFLEMVQRTALQVQINSDAILFSLIAAALSMLTMLMPVLQFSRITIVDYKRGKSGRVRKPLWQRFFLDILAFGIAVYGLFTFNNQRELMAMAMVDIQSVDPLLFLSASLFIIGLGLIALRIFPYFVKLIFFIGKKNWSPAMYASMLKVMRSSGEEQFIMIFLVFTMAVGIFSAQSARTINLNADHMILYQSGADITFRERWMDNQPPAGGGGMGPPADMQPSSIVYFEPDFARFTDFDEVDALARVFRRNVIVTQSGSTVNGVRLMGINTQEFGETIWTREDLHPIHINHFLNALSQRADAVLLSDNFRTRLGFSIGDGIVYRDANNRTARGVVYGFVEHWPGYAPVEWVRERTGETTQNDVFLMVANLGFLQTTWGVMPYEVWMRTNGYSNRFFYDFVAENNLLLDLFHDTSAALTDSRNDPIRQGTNGVLTVSFIVTLLICFTGFLIYWILSIKSRVLQFGIFRAMGLSMRNIISLLINEQLFITLMAVVIGAVVGEVTARLFVPLIQISYTAADQIIPLMIVAEQQDYFNLYSIVGMMIVLCLIILGILISKIKIAQALKLGED